MSVVRSERRGAVAVLTLDLPEKRNALSTQMRLDLGAALDAAILDKDVRAIVLTGGGGHFCAGGDISEMTLSADPVVAVYRLRLLHHCIRVIHGGQKPVVAAVEGAAAGAGTALAAACDHVVAARNARFSASFVNIGLAPDSGLQFTLAQRIGAGRARRLALEGTTFDAVEAHAMGLVDTLAEPGGALDAALPVAERLAAKAPLAVAAIKSAFAQGAASLDEALALELDLQPRLLGSADHAEAREAFFAKRTPVFSGR
ncbi:MAG: enoyl-CoA hydratase/isomerase family protein [Alphaproteobacteria bacterium]|nr:enoyl-CoA hydratase/isomerase family protein [Alphaproteobacteria bacterium]